MIDSNNNSKRCQCFGLIQLKVRSLKLDALRDSEAHLILAIGNDNANAIWEEGIVSQKGWEKPIESSSRKAKEEWIKSKYLWRGFLKFNEDDGKKNPAEREEKSCKEMYDKTKDGNVIAIARALAHGAVATWKNPNDDNKTALHVCAQIKTTDDNTCKAIECAELLLQNGAKMEDRDSQTQNILDSAILANADRAMIEYLSAKVT